jgi:diacylglycerol O-acyltransferase
MTGADAMFLYFERREMPLHIGSVTILDGAFDEECEQILAARLPEIPRYRQRVVFSPLNLTHPCWEYDPDFDIRHHIRHVRLDPPGGERQLVELSGQVFTSLMDRNRPLWDLTVVAGLEADRSALILRVHHSMMDGISGIELVKILFDTTREPRRVEPAPYHPPPLPEPNQVLVEGLAAAWSDMASRLLGAQISALRLFESYVVESPKESLRALLETMPELLRPAERLPFNQPCSGVRGHCWTTFSFAEVRAIRAALGGTINDVVLATVAGAISRYVAAHREPVSKRFARLLVPVNLRSGDERHGAGNEISMLPFSVPLDVPDPVERLRIVAARSAAMKAARIADVVSLLGTSLGWVPPNLQQTLAGMPFLPQPVLMFNMVCTNIPGPMIPLYANGREVLAYYPHVPCGSDVGIGVAVSSYHRNLHVGVTYDGQAAPDGELFRDFLVDSYEELRSTAGVRRAAAVPQQPTVAAQPAPPPEPVREVEPPAVQQVAKPARVRHRKAKASAGSR